MKNLYKYYKHLHSYFYGNRRRIYNILNDLTTEQLIVDNPSQSEHVTSEVDEHNNFLNFYFFYIQNFNPRIRRASFFIYTNKMKIPRNYDFFSGLNLSNYEIGNKFEIFLEHNHIRKSVCTIILNKNNINDVFMPIANKDMFPFFLTNDTTKLIIESNVKLKKNINLIYLKIHQSIVHKYMRIGSFLINIESNSFINIQDFNVIIKHYKKKKIKNNEFVFFYNIERFYGMKILNFFKRIRFRKFVKKFLDQEYNIYNDLSRMIIKYCY
jgi:hypothetical protein